jgi:hypothetical protein
MSPAMLVGFVVYAAVAALASELLVGIAAMHSGWFPAFATAFVFLLVGMALGFPPLPLAFLVGFTASSSPAFADMGYDLKAGWILRGQGADPALERVGRREQLWAELLGIGVAALLVYFLHASYFERNLFPPWDRVAAATISAGASPELARALLLWAIPGALLQAFGGPARQLGVLFATGLFVAGLAFGYFVALPAAVGFLTSYDSDQFNILIRARDYYNFVLLVLMSVGIVFLLPIFVLALARLGILPSSKLRRNRRIGYVTVAALAVALPGVDPVTTTMEMIPLMVLFELSIWLAVFFDRRWQSQAESSEAPEPAS